MRTVVVMFVCNFVTVSSQEDAHVGLVSLHCEIRMMVPPWPGIIKTSQFLLSLEANSFCILICLASFGIPVFLIQMPADVKS